MTPKLSIIIISFNTKDLTIACLNSVKKYVAVPHEVIVVDNASHDGSVEALKKRSDVTLIVNTKNTGFAAANNQGMKKAKGAYILLLNSDTLLTQDAVSPVIAYMESHEKVGIATCMLKNRDGSIQPSGGKFPSVIRTVLWLLLLDDIPFINQLVGSFHPKPEYFSSSHEQDWVTGAFFLLRRDVVKSIGKMDEHYFMYSEEMDYCYRAKKKGWKVYFLSSHSIIHYGGASSNKEYAILSELKGIRTFYKKHYGALAQAILTGSMFLGMIERTLLFFVLGRRSDAKIYAKALSQVL